MSRQCKYEVKHRNPDWTVCVWEDGDFDIDSVMPITKSQLSEILKIINAICPESMVDK